MLRFRTWLSTLAAVLLVAGPAMAVAWPTLFGLPLAFGQESSQNTTGDRPVVSTPVVSQAVEECAPHCASMAAWQRLWREGRFRDALRLAHTVLQAAPNNINAQHAYVVSQLVNAPRVATAPLAAARVAQCPQPCEFDPYDLHWLQCFDGIPTDAPLQIPTTSTVNSKDACCECPLSDCPLASFLETVFGFGSPSKSASGSPCPTADHCQNCPQVAGRDGKCDMQILRGPQGPTIIWIVREPGKNTATLSPLPPGFVPPLPSTTSIFLPSLPMLPPPAFSEQALTSSLPSPDRAPPPPPLLLPHDLQQFIPVPVPTVEAAPTQPTPRYVQATRFDPSELCEVPPPMPAVATNDVRIQQHGGRMNVSSLHCNAQCDRVHGGPNGEIVLEGNVRFQSRRHGQTLTIEAQRVLYDAKNGQFVVENARGLEQSRMNVAPISATIAHDRMQDSTSPCDDMQILRGEVRRYWRQDGPTSLTPIRVYGVIQP